MTLRSLAAFMTGGAPANRTTEADDFKVQMASAADDVKAEGQQKLEAFNDAREWLSEKIAPDQD